MNFSQVDLKSPFVISGITSTNQRCIDRFSDVIITRVGYDCSPFILALEISLKVLSVHIINIYIITLIQ